MNSFIPGFLRSLLRTFQGFSWDGSGAAPAFPGPFGAGMPGLGKEETFPPPEFPWDGPGFMAGASGAASFPPGWNSRLFPGQEGRKGGRGSRWDPWAPGTAPDPGYRDLEKSAPGYLCRNLSPSPFPSFPCFYPWIHDPSLGWWDGVGMRSLRIRNSWNSGMAPGEPKIPKILGI